MSNKFSPRSLPNVYRTDDSIQGSSNTPSWYNDFLSNLEKNSVKSQRSIHEDISAIMGNTKSKYSNVEEAVQDLKERTGLKAFLEAKQASNQEPLIFQKIPGMKIFIDNFVEGRPGTSVESVIHDLLQIDSIRNNLPNSTDVDNDVRVYINQKIADIQGKQPDINKVDLHIGKVDQSTSDEVGNDPLAICEPSRH